MNRFVTWLVENTTISGSHFIYQLPYIYIYIYVSPAVCNIEQIVLFAVAYEFLSYIASARKSLASVVNPNTGIMPTAINSLILLIPTSLILSTDIVHNKIVSAIILTCMYYMVLQCMYIQSLGTHDTQS